jgi:hypothetical protein
MMKTNKIFFQFLNMTFPLIDRLRDEPFQHFHEVGRAAHALSDKYIVDDTARDCKHDDPLDEFAYRESRLAAFVDLLDVGLEAAHLLVAFFAAIDASRLLVHATLADGLAALLAFCHGRAFNVIFASGSRLCHFSVPFEIRPARCSITVKTKIRALYY